MPGATLSSRHKFLKSELTVVSSVWHLSRSIYSYAHVQLAHYRFVCLCGHCLKPTSCLELLIITLQSYKVFWLRTKFKCFCPAFLRLICQDANLLPETLHQWQCWLDWQVEGGHSWPCWQGRCQDIIHCRLSEVAQWILQHWCQEFYKCQHCNLTKEYTCSKKSVSYYLSCAVNICHTKINIMVLSPVFITC